MNELNKETIDIEKKIFLSLTKDDNELINANDFISELKKKGIQKNDPRLNKLIKDLESLDNNNINYESFKNKIQQYICLITKVFSDNLIIPNFYNFTNKITEIYHNTLKNNEGNVASYIPQLKRVNPDQFGISICTISGQRFELGDTNIEFSIQSCCKPINYGIALEELGEENVHNYVGREPSGQSFNELLLNKDGKPHNPLINSGAIMTASLIKKHYTQSEKFEHIINIWSDLCGGLYKIGFNNPVYLSEKNTADRNFALAYFMKEINNKKKVGFPENININEVLELYFQCCSIEATTNILSIVAATLANGGINPFSGSRIFKSSTVKNILSMMMMCGMYDYSGEFAFKIGLPAKSGVAGAVMMVIPNVMGIATWSPRLDDIGNSTKGIEFCKLFGETFNFHIFDNLTDTEKIYPINSYYKSNTQKQFYELCLSASKGDLNNLKILYNNNIDMNQCDYDGRTALHLAVCENKINIVDYLVNKVNVKLDINDRWGNTPLDDAIRCELNNIIKLLKKKLNLNII
tara:strand:+ start:30 stop:1598 length:1569 start_codon:yes stop_codon:yes gene_type:complete